MRQTTSIIRDPRFLLSQDVIIGEIYGSERR